MTTLVLNGGNQTYISVLKYLNTLLSLCLLLPFYFFLSSPLSHPPFLSICRFLSLSLSAFLSFFSSLSHSLPFFNFCLFLSLSISFILSRSLPFFNSVFSVSFSYSLFLLLSFLSPSISVTVRIYLAYHYPAISLFFLPFSREVITFHYCPPPLF